jgi:SpoIID/LytB domain protein
MKKLLFSLFLISFLSLAVISIPASKAQDASCSMNDINSVCGGTNISGSACSDKVTQCTANANQALQESINATAPLQSRLDSLNSQVQGIKDTVAKIEASLLEKKKSIDQGYSDFAKQQAILDATIRDYYIKSYYDSPLVIFLSSATASQFTQILGYQRANADRDKAMIANIVVTIQDLETRKKELEDQETKLAAVKADLDQQSAQLNKIVSGAKTYQANLSSQIAQLSSIQQQILAQKYGSLGISLNSYNMSGGCKSDLLEGAPDPGFSPKIGFFTYGVPNRVGLNQFGAFGRARAGQSDSQILQAYYNYDSISGVDTNTQISVTGYGTYSLEDYLKRIYEVPDSWGSSGGMEALKAQAIAARSYAMAYTNNGQNPICSTDQCQVFQPNPKGGNWEQAVNATAGQVMLQGGSPIKAWFSSTHGGYVFTSADVGWSATAFTKRAQDASGPVNSFSDLQNNAYDKDSPWFYCDWGSRGGTAWLKQDELADIVNTVLLVQADQSTKEHLYQTDKPNPAGTDTWDSDRVKQELRNRNITPFNSVSGGSVDVDFGVGRVNTIHINGDAGTTSFSGDFFKTYFNIRAPGNIQIVGPLYNIEVR